jgi:hypothetical protein
MSRKDKIAVMKDKVVPALAAAWKESPEPNESVDCLTCHGDSVMEGKFDMPNPDLPKLDPSNQFAKHRDKMDWLKFMGSKVVPDVAAAMGMEPYNPDTQQGFGCFGCHLPVVDP